METIEQYQKRMTLLIQADGCQECGNFAVNMYPWVPGITYMFCQKCEAVFEINTNKEFEFDMVNEVDRSFALTLLNMVKS